MYIYIYIYIYIIYIYIYLYIYIFQFDCLQFTPINELFHFDQFFVVVVEVSEPRHLLRFKRIHSSNSSYYL